MRPIALVLLLVFASTAHAGIRLRTLGTQSTTGSTAAQFVELRATDDQQFRGSMRLVALDRLGATIFDAANLFDGQAEGATWPAGKSWLLALTTGADSIGIAPDHLMPAPLDTLAGAVELWDGATLVDHVAYGHALARPVHGHALEQDSTWFDEFSPSPTNFAGAVGSSSDCLCPGPGCADSTTAGIRIEKLAFTCANGDSSVRFLELRASRPNQRYLSFLFGLRAIAPNGTILFDRSNFLGPNAPYPAPWPEGGSYLLALPSLTSLTGLPIDQSFTFNSWPAGTTLMTWDAMVGAPIQFLKLEAALGPGQSLERVAGDSYAVVSRLSPRNRTGAEALVTSCPCDTSLIGFSYPYSPNPAPAATIQQQDGAIASYDAATGAIFTKVNPTTSSASVQMKEMYQLVGPPSANPIPFTATLRVIGNSSGTCVPHSVCEATQAIMSVWPLGGAIGSTGWLHGGFVGTSFDKTGTAQAQMLPGTWMHLSALVNTPVGIAGNVVASAQVTFALPEGYSFVSCHGATFTPPPPGTVDVPAARPGLALRALGAQPSRGIPAFECTLPSDGEAFLALVDLRGRIVHQEALGPMTAGPHRVEVARSLPPGVYWARLSFAGVRAQQKLILVGR